MGLPGGSDGKESATMWETWVRPSGHKDTPEKEVATHSSILAWRISWTEKQSMGRKEWNTTD